LLAVTAAARLALLLTLVGGIQVQAVQIEREKTPIQNTTARNTSKLVTDYYCSMIFATLIQYICLPFNAWHEECCLLSYNYEMALNQKEPDLMWESIFGAQTAHIYTFKNITVLLPWRIWEHFGREWWSVLPVHTRQWHQRIGRVIWQGRFPSKQDQPFW
jgi:hypothetical protein